MNHRLWEAYDTRANHDVPRFSAALDFSISILDISGHVTCTLVVLLSNVRETLHSMRVDELSGLLSLSLSFDVFLSGSLRPSSNAAPVPPTDSWETRRYDTSRDPLVCVSNACTTSFTHCCWSPPMQANFAAWLRPDRLPAVDVD